MNAPTAIVAITLLAAPWSHAQNVSEESQEDPVQAAIREFNRRDSKEPKEVTVVLAPPGEPAESEPVPEVVEPEPTPEGSPAPPVLVTGKAPEGTELIEEPGPADEADPADQTSEIPPPETLLEEPPPAPRKGLQVRVEKIQSGSGTLDPSAVKLLAPFPAKPLAQPPAGWRLETSESAPPFTRDVELSPGKSITLTVRPHLLVPDTNNTDVFAVAEPGFDPSLGYHQNATVGAVLSQSIRQLDDDSKALGNVIDNLQQLLVSLPKPEPEPEASPTREP